MVCTDCTGSCKSNYHAITTMTAHARNHPSPSQQETIHSSVYCPSPNMDPMNLTGCNINKTESTNLSLMSITSKECIILHVRCTRDAYCSKDELCIKMKNKKSTPSEQFQNTVGTIPKHRRNSSKTPSEQFQNTVGTVPKSNIKIVQRSKFDTTNTQIHDCSVSRLGAGTSLHTERSQTAAQKLNLTSNYIYGGSIFVVRVS